MLKDTLTYAVRSLAKRRLRSWLTIIGIFIGIAAVVALISLGQGLQTAIAGEFSSIGADRITVQPKGGAFGPPGLASAVKLDEDDLAVVQKAQHVDAAAGRLIKPVALRYDDTAITAFTASLPEDREERSVIENFLDPTIREGRWLEPDDTGDVVIGASLADNEEFRRSIPAGKNIQIENDTYEVVGVLEKKGIISIDSAILINEEDARKTLGLTDEYSVIVARAQSAELVNQAKEAVAKDLRQHRDVDEREEDFEVETSQEILDTLNTILGIVSGVLIGIAAISLLVGGVGIMNTMYTAVIERTKEIGIMKAIGATNAQILQIFLLEAGLLGLVGGVIGVLLGTGLAKAVELAARRALGPSVLQATIPAWLVIGALAFGFVVGTVSGTWPARQAAKLPPVEALR